MLTVQRMFRNSLKWKKKNHKLRHNKNDNKRIGLGFPRQKRKPHKASAKRRAKSLRKQMHFGVGDYAPPGIPLDKVRQLDSK